MKLAEILPLMSKLYLNRTVSSFIKDVRLSDEAEMRELVLRNQAEFYNTERVRRNLDFLQDERDIDVLNELICICLTRRPQYLATYSQLLDDVQSLEKQIVADSKNSDYMAKAVPQFAQEIYLPVLKAAWDKDESLNAHEKNILDVLRTVLKLSRRHHRLVESQISRFPQKGNKSHSSSQIDLALRDLQMKGIVLRFKSDDEYFVIPEEISSIVRYTIGGEMKPAAFKLLLEHMKVDQLKAVLNAHKIPSSAAKPELVRLVQRFDVLPSDALDALTTSELTDLLRPLEGARVSGTKEVKIREAIDYFEEVMSPKAADPTDDRADYYVMFEALAARNYRVLRDNRIIKKDLDIERFFESATRYIFEKKLGHPVMPSPGSRHADGRVQYSRREVLLWDNKSCEGDYDFPEAHYEQFLRYIESEPSRVTVFLVVAPSFAPQAVVQAQRLKANNRTDTDIALIGASDLMFVAEEWRDYSSRIDPQFNLQIFNTTGLLDRAALHNRMSWGL